MYILPSTLDCRPWNLDKKRSSKRFDLYYLGFFLAPSDQVPNFSLQQKV